MNDTAQNLLTDFKRHSWKTPDLYPRLFELAKSPAALFDFLQGFLAAYEKNATLFNDALSYIDKEHFGMLVEQAIDSLKSGPNENAENVIEYASLQFPELLHDKLNVIAALNPNAGAYYEEYPWRKLAREAIPAFWERLASAATPLDEKRKLFTCLLETRDEETLAFACDYFLGNPLFDVKDPENYLTACLEQVGYTRQNGVIRNYCPNRTRHLVFPDKYFAQGRPVFLSKKQHPTWRLPAGEQSFAFGGVLDSDRANPFFHIATFDEIPNGLHITALKQLTLGCHVRELNACGPVFYQHDVDGKPQRVRTYESDPDELFADHPIKKACISLAETPPRWEFQSWGTSNGRENLFRLGGEPTWIQGADVPCCPHCHEKMDFLMQLDSDLPDSEEGELMFGSGGIGYVFWCDKSKVSGYLMQCT